MVEEDFLSEEDILHKKTTFDAKLSKKQEERLVALGEFWDEKNNEEKKGPLERYTVSEITRCIKDRLENGFARVSVLGEISQKKEASSGYCYFTLVDEDSSLLGVLSPENSAKLDFNLEEGTEVECCGDIRLWKKRGQYQLFTLTMVDRGEGAQERKYQKLKNKLEKEGLFAAETKKSLPRCVHRIALMTSEKGAVIHDFIETLNQIFPGFTVVVFPVNVSGEDTQNVVFMLERLKKIAVDVVVLARGGGSKDDLSFWNDEDLLRALYACPFPTLSAIGHESDWVLCDLVCDVRASTPTQAASMLARNKESVFLEVLRVESAMKQALKLSMSRYFYRLKNLEKSIDPRNLLIKINFLENHLSKIVFRIRKAIVWRLDFLEQRLVKFFSLREVVIRRLHFLERNLVELEQKIYPFSDRSAKVRGYASIFSAEKWQKRIKNLQKGETITIKMFDGSAEALVIKKIRAITGQ